MVTRGKPRGNGSQLASYLLTKGDNENVTVFDIRGTASPNDLRKSLIEMSLTSELTKSDKGLYHAQINPAIGEDRVMTKEDWFRSAEILENELGLSLQKRVMVLHEKKGRVHAHLVWERFDHEKGRMISDSYSRLAQDRARKTMELELEQQKTPERNKKRPEIKATLTELWQNIPEAKSFIAAAKAKGYLIARGTQRPYMVIDETGRSFDLVRQLDGVRTKEVKGKFKGLRLPGEKEAIVQARELNRARGLVKEKAEEVKGAEVPPKPEQPVKDTRLWTMQSSFVIKASQQKDNKKVLEKIQSHEISKEAERQKIVEDMKRRKSLAQKFRDNDLDMTVG